MTSIFLAGGENPTHQQILVSCGVQHVAVNVTSLLRRKPGAWALDLPYPDWEWVAYCDGPASRDDLDSVIGAASKPPLFVVGPMEWKDDPDYLPLWNGEEQIPGDRVNGLAITDRVFRDRHLARRALASRTVGTTLGVLTGSIDSNIGRYDIVISGSWWSSMKFGETQVWDGLKMHRYNADRQGEVRTRHREHIEAMGIDPDQVLLGDADEVARLAVTSWQYFEEHLQGGLVLPYPSGVSGSLIDTQDTNIEAALGLDLEGIDMIPAGTRHQTPLPVMRVGSISSVMGEDDQAVVRNVSESIRQCDNCFLAQSKCPGYRPESSCAYSIPVEIRTKDQLQGVLTAMVELQTQRVLQARFAEEITGQELTPEVGREMDRLFNSIERMRDIMDNRDSVKMTVEARGRAGVLSRLFGEQVGDNARQLAQPVESTDIMDAVLED